MKIAVCDDDEVILQQMDKILSEEGYEAVVYKTPKDMSYHYAVYFLDIDMHGDNGITIGRKIKEQNPYSVIIYLTNFDDYRSQAFGVHAFDYLKKPVDQIEISRVLQDIKKYLYRQEPLLTFKTKEGVLQIHLGEILYFEFYGRKVILHATEKQYELSSSLRSIAEKMEAYYFVMPHKSFCVNLANIRLLKGYDITMLNGDRIPLSQKKSQKFREELNNFLYHKVSNGILL